MQLRSGSPPSNVNVDLLRDLISTPEGRRLILDIYPPAAAYIKQLAVTHSSVDTFLRAIAQREEEISYLALPLPVVPPDPILPLSVSTGSPFPPDPGDPDDI